jgi:hypothetical protein
MKPMIRLSNWRNNKRSYIQPLQDNTAATIKALTDKINRLEQGGSSTKRGGGSGRVKGEESGIRDGYSLMERTAGGTLDVGTMITTVGHVDLILNTTV